MKNIHIENSYLVKDELCMFLILYEKYSVFPESPVWSRGICSLIYEWKAHNLLYNLNICRSRTADVDLDDESVWRRAVYFVLSVVWNLYYGIKNRKNIKGC